MHNFVFQAAQRLGYLIFDPLRQDGAIHLVGVKGFVKIGGEFQRGQALFEGAIIRDRRGSYDGGHACRGYNTITATGRRPFCAFLVAIIMEQCGMVVVDFLVVAKGAAFSPVTYVDVMEEGIFLSLARSFINLWYGTGMVWYWWYQGEQTHPTK